MNNKNNMIRDALIIINCFYSFNFSL